MSVLLQARHLPHQAGPQRLFDDLSLVVNAGDRIGSVGHNGCGESTLLKLLSREQAPDAGEIVVQRGLRIAQVAQLLPVSMQREPLRDALLARRGAAGRFCLHQGAVAATGWQPPGGQQNRLMFAQALAADPQLLLLDEPTNHLDLATTVLFEERLRSFAGACVLVSHDRACLDAVTSTAVFLRDRVPDPRCRCHCRWRVRRLVKPSPLMRCGCRCLAACYSRLRIWCCDRVKELPCLVKTAVANRPKEMQAAEKLQSAASNPAPAASGPSPQAKQTRYPDLGCECCQIADRGPEY